MKRVPVGVQFALLALAWGASFLFIKIGLEGLSFGQVVLGRVASGALTLGVIVAATRQPLPKDAKVWAHLLIVAILLCVAPFLLFAWAEQHVSSGLASVYNATTPLMTMVVALVALPSERVTRERLIALRAFGTGLAYVWNTNIVAAWGATNASTVTYLTPLVGVALGVLLLGEKPTWSEPLGALLVISGIAASQGRLKVPHRPRTRA